MYYVVMDLQIRNTSQVVVNTIVGVVKADVKLAFLPLLQ